MTPDVLTVRLEDRDIEADTVLVQGSEIVVIGDGVEGPEERIHIDQLDGKGIIAGRPNDSRAVATDGGSGHTTVEPADRLVGAYKQLILAHSRVEHDGHQRRLDRAASEIEAVAADRGVDIHEQLPPSIEGIHPDDVGRLEEGSV